MHADDAATAEDCCRERSARHARVLQRLAEIGMNLAEDVDRQRREPGADAAELAMKFARIAKAVRQTLVLEAHLADEERLRRDAAEARRRAEQARLFRELQFKGQVRKAQAFNALERDLAAREPGLDRQELRADIGEWLLDESEAERYADRPVEDIIAEITALLGVQGWDGLDERSGTAADEESDWPDDEGDADPARTLGPGPHAVHPP